MTDDETIEHPTEGRFAKELIQGGSEMAGAATGAALGFIGGPLGVVGGAAAGAALARVLARVGADLRHRMLGAREEVRIGAAAAFAGEAIAEHLAAGRQPRGDGFFDERGSDRPAAEELLEGVLLKARDAYEEKKVRVLGRLYAKVAFHPEISPSNANFLISLVGQLTYRQLVALGIAQSQHQLPLLRTADFRGDSEGLQGLGNEGVTMLTELYDLYQRGLIHGGDGSAWLSVSDVTPGGMRTQGSGFMLALLAELYLTSDDWGPFLAMFPPDAASQIGDEDGGATHT